MEPSTLSLRHSAPNLQIGNVKLAFSSECLKRNNFFHFPLSKSYEMEAYQFSLNESQAIIFLLVNLSGNVFRFREGVGYL